MSNCVRLSIPAKLQERCEGLQINMSAVTRDALEAECIRRETPAVKNV